MLITLFLGLLPIIEGFFAARTRTYMALEVVILAAGQGTRMRSSRSKVLHEVGGKPMLQHVMDAAATVNPSRSHVVVRPDADDLKARITGDPVWVNQTEQNGTSHAVAQALPGVDDDSVVMVLYGDVPLVTPATLKRCADAAAQGAVSLVTALFEDPAELGRIVRENGRIQRIIEFKDADESQREIREINSGILAAPKSILMQLMAQVGNDNAQGEYYLTDIIGLAVDQNIAVEGVQALSEMEVTGVNNRAQLAEVERAYQARMTSELMAVGVTMADPSRVDVRGSVQAGQDVFIDVNVVLQGDVVLESGVHISSNCVITDSRIGAGTRVEPNTVIEGAVLAAECTVGPFARIRPGTELAEGAKVGNFVETKKAKLGKGSKASHLTYLGDVTLGEGCNVGAGTITCNYDGVNKHQTTIGDDVFVGSNSTLVAPVVLEDGSFVAAGSTVTTKVGQGDLAVGRGKQRNIHGWSRPSKQD